jgi:hypothetical protein
MSKRKAHNPVKRYEVQARAALSDVALVMVLGVDDNHVTPYRLKTASKIPVSMTVAKALTDCCFKFAVLLVVWSVENNGKQRTVTHYERMASPYRHLALIDHLNEQHQALIGQEKERGNNVIGAGWVIVPVPTMTNDELEEKMMRVIENASENI